MPWIVGFLAFQLGPTLAAFVLSLSRYNVITPPQWIGVDNYVYALTVDPLFWRSLARTVYYVGVSVPFGIVASLGLALLLNTPRRSIATYRTLFFLPNLTPVVAAAILWQWIFHPPFGPLNSLLGLIGVPPIGWLGSVEWAVPSLILISFWYGIGGSRMVITFRR